MSTPIQACHYQRHFLFSQDVTGIIVAYCDLTTLERLVQVSYEDQNPCVLQLDAPHHNSRLCTAVLKSFLPLLVEQTPVTKQPYLNQATLTGWLVKNFPSLIRSTADEMTIEHRQAVQSICHERYHVRHDDESLCLTLKGIGDEDDIRDTLKAKRLLSQVLERCHLFQPSVSAIFTVECFARAALFHETPVFHCYSRLCSYTVLLGFRAPNQVLFDSSANSLSASSMRSRVTQRNAALLLQRLTLAERRIWSAWLVRNATNSSSEVPRVPMNYQVAFYNDVVAGRVRLSDSASDFLTPHSMTQGGSGSPGGFALIRLHSSDTTQQAQRSLQGKVAEQAVCLYPRALNAFERSLFKVFPSDAALRSAVTGTDGRVVVDRGTFMQRMDVFHHHFKWKQCMDWADWVQVGGSVLRCVLPEPFECEGQDLDFYYVGGGDFYEFDDAVNAVLKRFSECLLSVSVVAESQYVRHFQVDQCEFQFIWYSEHMDPALVLNVFDLDCCQIAFDGQDVLATHACVQSLRTRTMINYKATNSQDLLSFLPRTNKYAARGFALLLPHAFDNTLLPESLPSSAILSREAKGGDVGVRPADYAGFLVNNDSFRVRQQFAERLAHGER